MKLAELATALRESRGFAHKRDIADVMAALGDYASQAIAIGDDCAAIPNGDGWLLFAIEGFVDDFVQKMPWFAGWCGVMVNASDVYAMGGRPIAVVDALWSRGMDPAAEVLAGMAAASARYGIPVVGGHSNNRSERPQLAVAILGQAKALLTSFDAQPGDTLVMAIDLRGAYQEPNPYWNASTAAPGARLKADLELLPALAEDGLCRAAKDISMAGAVGTALMLAECSKVGMVIDVDAIPRPAEAPLARWLQSFPSYGFVLSVDPEHVDEVLRRFRAREIDCAVVGKVDDSRQLKLRQGDEEALLWHIDQPFITARPHHA